MTEGDNRKTIAVLGIRGFPGVQGGVEVHCQHLYPLMTQYHFRVYRRKPYLTKQSDPTGYDNIDFIDWRTTRIQGLEAAWHTMRAVMHCIVHRPDLVHVHNMGPAVFVLPLKWLGIPVVMTYHSINYEHAKWGKVARWLLRKSEQISLRYCDRIIFVNRQRMQQMDASVLSKSVVIPNGVEPARPTDATDFLQQHGIKPQQYLLAIGRISPEKGLEHLILAANQSTLISQVVIVGDCDHGERYLQQLKSLDVSHKTVFTGFAIGDQLNQLYSHARAFVLPSLSEGFPLVMLEAMAHHLPIVASELDATRLVNLPQDCYCVPGDATSLQSAIEAQLKRPYAPIDYDLSAYDWCDIASRTQGVYDQILTQVT